MRLLPEKGRERRTAGNERAEEVFHRHDEDSVTKELRISSVEKNGTGLGVVLAERLEPGEVGRMEDVRVLDFDRGEIAFPVENEIDLYSRLRTPVAEEIGIAGIVVPGLQMLENETFERGSVDLGRPIKRSGRPDRPEHAGIEEVELLVRNQRALGPFGENGKPCREEHVVQDGEVSVDSRPFDAAFACDFACRKNGTVREGGGFEKSRKSTEIADDSLGRHFFLDIKVDVGLENVGGVFLRLADDERYHALPQCAGKRKVPAHLAGEERMAEPLDGPSAKQIGVFAAFEFSRAGSGKDELDAGIFVEQLVDNVQKRRNALDFVDHERVGCGVSGDDLGEALGTGFEGSADGGNKQIDDDRFRIGFLEPGCLARSSRTEQKETPAEAKYCAGFRFHARHDSRNRTAMQRLFYGDNGKSDADFTKPMEKCLMRRILSHRMTRKVTSRPAGVRRCFLRAAAAALAALCVAADAATRVHPGHYASGTATWTIEDGRVYRGHYASGTAAYTMEDGRIYAGHYASGTAVFTWKGGRLYRGHYASGTAAYTMEDGRIYAGHYASGTAVFTWKDGRLYRGHYASGTAVATISGDSAPDDMTLAFIAIVSGL